MKKFMVLIALLVAPLLSFASGLETLQIETLGEDQYLSYNFGHQFLNSRRYVDYTLTAMGPAPTEIRRINISGMHYDAATNCPKILEAGKKCTLRAYYWPTTEGHHWGNLDVYLNDGNIYIRLFGIGVR